NFNAYDRQLISTRLSYKNIILRYLEHSVDREYLLKIQSTFANINTLEFYTDGSLINQGSIESNMTFGFWETTTNTTFTSASTRYPSSYHAEVFAILTCLITSPHQSRIKIFTDSQSALLVFNNYKRNNYNVSTHNIFKIDSMTNLWISILEIINELQLTVDIEKVLAHSGVLGNEKIDKEVTLTHNDNYKYLTTSNNSYQNLLFYPLWKNIPINVKLRKFITNLSREEGLEQFLSLNRNKKYMDLEVDWPMTFQLLNTDIENTRTSFASSNLKRKKVQLLIEELPTVEQLKKSNLTLYEHMYCVKCEQYNETFNHVFLCPTTSTEVKDIILHMKNHLLQSINKHLTDRSKHVGMDDISKLTFWDYSFSLTNLTILDIFKGIISYELTTFVSTKVRTKTAINNTLSCFRKYTMDNFRALWQDRCDQQIDKEKNLGINKRLKKLSRNYLMGRNYHSDVRDNTPNPIRHRGMEYSIDYGGKLQDYYIFGGSIN